MEMIVSDQHLEISHEPGEAQSAIVSFSGIGLGLGGIQIEEFRRSLTGSRHHIFFVKDLERRWYGDGLLARICDVLNERIDALGIRRVATLGNSMGGFGAICAAASLHHCATALAFAPQSAADPAIVPWETRWVEWRDRLTRGTGLDATYMLAESVDYVLFFGSRGLDARHAARLREAATDRTIIITVPQSDHDCVAALKSRGVLSRIIEAAVERGAAAPWTSLLSPAQDAA